MTSETISVIANLALALSFFIALIFGVVQVRIAVRDRRERLTLETIRNFQTREFAEILYNMTNNVVPSTQEEFQAIPEKQQIIFMQFAQQMEHLGLLVAEKILDMDLVEKTLGSFVTTSWEKYKPAFMDIRKKNSDPFLGEYFQRLAEQIEQRMREHPRKPAFEKKA